MKTKPVFQEIEAHTCQNFPAYKVYNEHERQLKVNKSDLSPEKVIKILQSIVEIEITTPKSKEKIKKTLLLNQEQNQIARIFILALICGNQKKDHNPLYNI